MEKQTSGHWTALIRYQNIFEYFDSYGNAPDYDLKHWLTEDQRMKLKENTTYLSNVLKDHKTIYNKIQYQELKDDVNDCGDHVCYRCYKFKKEGFTLADYQKHMKNMCKLYGTSPDRIVSEFISSWIN